MDGKCVFPASRLFAISVLEPKDIPGILPRKFFFLNFPIIIKMPCYFSPVGAEYHNSKLEEQRHEQYFFCEDNLPLLPLYVQDHFLSFQKALDQPKEAPSTTHTYTCKCNTVLCYTLFLLLNEKKLITSLVEPEELLVPWQRQ